LPIIAARKGFEVRPPNRPLLAILPVSQPTPQMQLHYSLVAVLASLHIAVASGRKGSCDGNWTCDHAWTAGMPVLQWIRAQTFSFPKGHKFKNGEHIICRYYMWGPAGFCAFLENTKDGASGQRVLELLKAIADRGCTRCGSYPVKGEKGTPEWDGQLTVNYVHATNCEGACI